MVVVEDGPELTALWLSAGTPCIAARPLDPAQPKPWRAGEWELRTSRWDRWQTLFLLCPGDWHAVWLRWTPDWQFIDWYVNLQEPFVRRPDGFWVRDLQLDIVVGSDGSWRFKDVSDFERSIELGVLSEKVGRRVRTEADTVVGHIEAGAAPFDRSWNEWRPGPGLAAPLAIPPGHLAGRAVGWAVASTRR